MSRRHVGAADDIASADDCISDVADECKVRRQGSGQIRNAVVFDSGTVTSRQRADRDSSSG